MSGEGPIQTGKSTPRRLSLFRIPLLLWVATAVGLIAALLGDGLWDALSWFLLSLAPIVVLTRLLRIGKDGDRPSFGPHP